MGMPRKGSRHITVDGKDFLWRFEGHRRYYGNAFRAGTLTVQEDVSRPGRVMQAELISKNWTEDMAEGLDQHKATLCPSDVEKTIRVALERGWTPNERGVAWKDCGVLELKEYRTRAEKDFLTF